MEANTKIKSYKDLGFTKADNAEALLAQIEELQKMLNNLRHRLAPRPSPLAPNCPPLAPRH
jgi:hypothetical protein